MDIVSEINNILKENDKENENKINWKNLIGKEILYQYINDTIPKEVIWCRVLEVSRNGKFVKTIQLEDSNDNKLDDSKCDKDKFTFFSPEWVEICQVEVVDVLEDKDSKENK